MIIRTTREDHRIAWLAALAIGIHVLESGFPSPLPGIKPGLANVVTIAVLMQFGWRVAAWVTLLRVLAGSLLLGTFMSPTFMLSLGGAVAGIGMLRLVTLGPGIGAGPIGYSILAALAHMAAQFYLAWLLFIPHAGLLVLLPPLMTAALLFGLGNGIIANMMLAKTAAHP